MGAENGRGEPCGLQMRLFGPMEVQVGGVPLPHLRSRKGLWLLALLALRAGRDLDRGWLAGVLWPDSDDEDARRSLRQSLHDLRLQLGPEAWRLPAVSSTTLRLAIPAPCVDVLAFDEAIARCDPASLELGVGLYRGPLLEDCSEEWCLEERRGREQTYIRALECLASAAAARSDHAAAVAYLRRAVGAEPYREDLQRALMGEMASSGDAVGALLAYREFRDLLWREMSAAPADETTALFRELRDAVRRRPRNGGAALPARSQVPSAAPQTQQFPGLPVPLTRLVGRDQAVRDVAEALRTARLVTLTGPGGIGKTRLATRAAEELRGDYADGVRFADLSAVAEPAAVAEAVRQAVGAPPPGQEESPGDAAARHLGPLDLLLVLDNCEHVLPSCAGLAGGLLRRCPGLRILATSREVLGLAGEAVWQVPPLELPAVPASGRLLGRHGHLQSLGGCAAVRLFEERAQAVQPGFHLAEHNVQWVVEICRRLDGIPLAIELAAARVRSLPVGEIAARLQTGFGLLKGSPAPALARQQTLAATFDWSWHLLSDPEQAVLRRLSVFAGGCALRAAEAVCAGDAVAGEQVIEQLASLVGKSLAVYDPAGAGYRMPDDCAPDARYRLLETVRQYAADRLEESGEGPAVRCRHRDLYLGWAEAVAPWLWRRGQAEWFERLEVEHDNLRAALSWSKSDGALEKELRLASALSRFWDTHGHLREGRNRIEDALSRAADGLPSSLRASLLGQAGWMASAEDDHAAARAHYEGAVAILLKYGDLATAASTVGFLAASLARLGELGLARSRFEQALELHERAGTGRGVAALLNNLADLELRLGHYDAARGHLTASVRQSVQHELPQLQGVAVLNLAVLARLEGRCDEACERCAEGLRLFRDCGTVVGIPGALEQMADVELARKRPARAASLLGAAAIAYEATGQSLPREAVPDHEAALAAAREALGGDAFDEAFAAGRAMGIEQAVAYALGERLDDGGPAWEGRRPVERRAA